MTSRTRRPLAALLGLTTTVSVVAFMGLMVSGAGAVPTSPDLGTAANASVMAGTTVTNTGPSTLSRGLDLSPGTAVTGFPPGLVAGTVHLADGAALIAQNDLTAAYHTAAAAPSTADTTGVDLGTRTLTSGVYTASSSMSLNGALTLSGDASSVFIFQAGSTLITGSASSVLLIGGVQACNVWWQVGSSATLGTGTTFAGNIMALTSISVQTGTTVDGRALARNGAVTLDDDVFTSSPCAVTPPPTTTSAAPTTTTPATTTATTTSATTRPAATTTTGPALPKTPIAFTSEATTTLPAVVGPPRTGGGPERTPSSPWLPVLVLSLAASAALASGLGLGARRRHQQRG